MGGKEVAGAEMTVTDEEGNVIDAWTSDRSEHRVAGLEEDTHVTVTIKNDAQPKLGVNVPFISIGIMVIGVAGLIYALTSNKKHSHYAN